MAVLYGTPNDLGAVLGGANTDAMQYIEQSVNRFMEQAASVGQVVAERIGQQYQQFVSSNIGQQAAAIKNMIRAAWQDDVIYPISDWDMLQNAPDTMVRYLMANPTIRPYYFNGQANGYGKRYINTEPNLVSRDQYDYRRVTNGVVMDDGHYHQYHESIIGDDAILTQIERMSILSTWETMDEMIEEGVDPTCPWNGSIG